MPTTPVDDLCTMLERVSGRRPTLDEAVALLLEAAVSREGWLRAGVPLLGAAGERGGEPRLVAV